MVYHRYRDCFCCIASHYKGDLIVSKGISYILIFKWLDILMSYVIS